MDASRSLDQDQTASVSRVSSSRATWQNLRCSFSIEQIRLNYNDSHPSISSEPLIEYETPIPTITPKFVYLYTCSSTKNVLLDTFE